MWQSPGRIFQFATLDQEIATTLMGLAMTQKFSPP